MKGGRGLELGHPDLIPLERTDILEDLKQIVDVHRLTDFSLHDRVVPTIELRRSEDELVLSLWVFVGQLAANFSIVQLFNPNQTVNIRPVAIHLESGQGIVVQMSFDTVALGALTGIGVPLDRRRTGAFSPAQLRSTQAVAVPGLGAFFSVYPGASQGRDVPQKVLDNLVLPPGTGINFAPGTVNQDLAVSVAYKVQQINPTRPTSG